MKIIAVLLLTATVAAGQTIMRLQLAGDGVPSGFCNQARYTNLLNGDVYLCNDETHTWSAPTVPVWRFQSGMVIVSLTTCPVGTTEMTSWAGKTLIATTSAAGDAGTTGGSDSITPQGTNSGGAVSTHTGTAVADHAAHTHTFTASSNASTPDLVTSNTAGSGVAQSGTTGNPSATLTHNVTQPAAHTFTQPTFTGLAFDNRSAFIKVLFCRRD